MTKEGTVGGDLGIDTMEEGKDPVFSAFSLSSDF